MRRAFRSIGCALLLLTPLACAPAAAPTPAAQPAAPAGSGSAASAPPPPAAPPAPVTINYAHPVISSQYWHMFVGKEKGLYAAEGINIEPIFIAAGNPA